MFFPTPPGFIFDIGRAFDWTTDLIRRTFGFAGWLARVVGDRMLFTLMLGLLALLFSYALLSEDALIGQPGVRFHGVDAPVLAEWNQEQQVDAFKATSPRGLW